MPVPADELPARLETLRRGQGSAARRRQNRLHLQSTRPEAIAEPLAPMEPELLGQLTTNPIRRVFLPELNIEEDEIDVDFWLGQGDAPLPPAAPEMIAAVADQYVPPPPTVEAGQQTEGAEQADQMVQATASQTDAGVQVAAVVTRPCGSNTDDDAAGFLPPRCSLHDLAKASMEMPQSGSCQIAAELLLRHGTMTRGQRRQLEDVVLAVMIGQRAVAQSLIEFLNAGLQGTRQEAETTCRAALRQLEEQASRYIDKR